jgi:hypothetical protein
MSTARRLVLQSVIAGLVAGLLSMSALGLANAQWGDPQPTPTATATAAPEQGAPAPAPVPPCELITLPEAEAALGTSATTTSDATQCTHLANDLSGRAVAVSLTTDLPSEEGALQGAMAQVASAFQTTAEPVALGSEAYAVVGGVMAQLAVRLESGEVLMVMLTVPNGSRQEVVGTLTDLAQIALGRA